MKTKVIGFIGIVIATMTVTVMFLSYTGAIRTPQVEPIIEAMSSTMNNSNEVVLKATGKDFDITVVKVSDNKYEVTYVQNKDYLGKEDDIRMYDMYIRYTVDHWDVEVQKEVCEGLM